MLGFAEEGVSLMQVKIEVEAMIEKNEKNGEKKHHGAGLGCSGSTFSSTLVSSC